MFRTGKECDQPGIYRSNDCGYEITLGPTEAFPQCPIHDRPVTWTFIKKVDPPRTRSRRKQAEP